MRSYFSEEEKKEGLAAFLAVIILGTIVGLVIGGTIGIGVALAKQNYWSAIASFLIALLAVAAYVAIRDMAEVTKRKKKEKEEADAQMMDTGGLKKILFKYKDNPDGPN